MSRKAPKITKEELELKIKTWIYKNTTEKPTYKLWDCQVIRYLGNDHSQVSKDLSKIIFDFENATYSSEFMSSDLQGYNTLDNGFTFLGCSAGGDWEYPIFFIIYWDGKSLRGYIPEDGNTFNPITRTAFGSEEERDPIPQIEHKHLAILASMLPRRSMTEDLIPLLTDPDALETLHEYADECDMHEDKIIADIKARIQIV